MIYFFFKVGDAKNGGRWLWPIAIVMWVAFALLLTAVRS